MKAWYTTHKSTLNNNDGRKIVVGKTHQIIRPILLCSRGLHASERLSDSLRYGAKLNRKGKFSIYRVELSGETVIGSDKLAAERRKYLYKVDLDNSTIAGHIEDIVLEGITKDQLKSFYNYSKVFGTSIYNLLNFTIYDMTERTSKKLEQVIKKYYNYEETGRW